MRIMSMETRQVKIDIVSLISRMLHIAETDIASTLSGILIGAISGG